MKRICSSTEQKEKLSKIKEEERQLYGLAHYPLVNGNGAREFGAPLSSSQVERTNSTILQVAKKILGTGSGEVKKKERLVVSGKSAVEEVD